MQIPLEFMQLAGVGLLMAVAWVAGVKWGRNNPDKVSELSSQLKALENTLKK